MVTDIHCLTGDQISKDRVALLTLGICRRVKTKQIALL